MNLCVYVIWIVEYILNGITIGTRTGSLAYFRKYIPIIWAIKERGILLDL